ncbi:Retrovirus-related Pol polyprotein from transposon RE2, partial [Linum perenne]
MLHSLPWVSQDPRKRTQIGVGTKVGRSFYLQSFPIGTKKVGVHLDGAKDSTNSSCFMDSASLNHNCYSAHLSSVTKWLLWHSRLGHPHSARLKFMIDNDMLPVRLNSKSVDDANIACTHCIGAKASKLPFQSSDTVISNAFDLVHTDLWGPSPVTSRLGYRYFALFIDHATRFTWVYMLRAKSDLLPILKGFLAMVQTQFHKKIKVIRSDSGGEYSSAALKDLYLSHGIHYQMSCPGVSEQNGLVERKNRHVLELARALILQSQVPQSFWPEVVDTVIYLINRQVTPTLSDKPPYLALYGRMPSYSMLRVFGCVCFVLLPRTERTKLTSKTAKCVFMGYSHHHKGYMCYDPALRRIRVAYHVYFLENQFYYHTQPTVTTSHARPPNIFDFASLDTSASNPHILIPQTCIPPPNNQSTPPISSTHCTD